jgi:hypothetical protein
MKSILFFFALLISVTSIYAQNNLFFLGKSIVKPIYGRFSHYSYSFTPLLSMPSTNMNFTRTFCDNTYSLEMGHTQEGYANPAFNWNTLSTLVVDTANIYTKQYYLLFSGRIWKARNEKHHFYVSIGGAHRYQADIGTFFKNDYSSFPEFTGENIPLRQSFGLKSTVSYLFMWKLLAVKTYFGGNYFPNYKDLQLEAGVRIGLCVSDKQIKHLVNVFRKKE